MSLATMIAEMRGAVPGYSALLARTHLQEVWKDIRNMKGWSFQLGNSSFAIPGKVSVGGVTASLGISTVIANAAATTAWLTASTPVSLLAQRQFRIGYGTIYNIIAYDNGQTPGQGNYPFATLTLDRPYIDLTAGANLGYTIYQCYIPTPVREFEAWESVLDVTNVIWLRCNANRGDRERIDRADPQRQIFSNPGTLLPYQVDSRPGSATIGSMMYELYPQPQNQYAYSTWYSWLGAELVNPSDPLPFPMTEHCVKAGARIKAYEFAEANKDPANPRGSGADYRFLMGAASEQYQAQLKEIRMLDRDRVDMWKSTMTRLNGFGPEATFDPSNGRVSARNL